MKNSKILSELKNKTILVTGGAGSIGTVVVKKLLEYPIKTVRVLDIDEHALFRLKKTIHDDRIRLLLGSVLDKERIDMAGNNVDIIIHLAAIKNIEISEFNPMETVDTNINGLINLIKMTMRNKPGKFLNISTDKAVEPSTLYGTTKQLGERLTMWAGQHIFPTKFSSVRLGNVIETRGNVFEVWDEEVKNNKPLSITDPKMKRYFFHIENAVEFILQCIILTNRGEIFVPKMELHSIKKLSNKISKKHKIIGIRGEEKIIEKLISDKEITYAQNNNEMWIIKPRKISV